MAGPTWLGIALAGAMLLVALRAATSVLTASVRRPLDLVHGAMAALMAWMLLAPLPPAVALAGALGLLLPTLYFGARSAQYLGSGRGVREPPADVCQLAVHGGMLFMLAAAGGLVAGASTSVVSHGLGRHLVSAGSLSAGALPADQIGAAAIGASPGGHGGIMVVTSLVLAAVVAVTHVWQLAARRPRRSVGRDVLMGVATIYALLLMT